MTIWECRTHVCMTSMTSSVEWTDLDFKISVALLQSMQNLYELPNDKTNEMAVAPSEDSDQPGHPPSLIRVFTVRSMSS